MTPSPGLLWDRVVGQDSAVTFLRRAVAGDRLAHAYAFVGPAGVGRRLTALGLAQTTLCPEGGCGICGSCRRVAAGQHPDCQLLSPTPPRENPRGALAIRIGEVRELMHALALSPWEGRRKVAILDGADRMTLPTAQALLKTLEEPPPRTLLILVLANPRALPPTVLSRCQRVRFRPLAAGEAARVLEAHGVASESSGLLARLVQGQVGVALAGDLDGLRQRRGQALALAGLPLARLAVALDGASVERDRALVGAYLEVYWHWYRDALCLAAGGGDDLLVNLDQREALAALAGQLPPARLLDILDAVKRAWLALEGNVSPRLALEHAVARMAAPAA